MSLFFLGDSSSNSSNCSTLRKDKKESQARRIRRKDAQGLQEQVGCVEFCCGTAEDLVRACDSEPNEEKERQQHGGTTLLTMGSD